MHSEVKNNGVFVVGEIGVQTLNDEFYRRYIAQCRLPEIEFVDFGGVTRADSTAISLVLTALRESFSKVKLHNLPESVLALAELYEIQEWIH